MNTKLLICSMLALSLLCSCRTSGPKANATADQAEALAKPAVKAAASSPKATYIPRALVYKTNGDWADHVFINLDADGQPVGYPDPSDISAGSAPVAVGDGFMLDRRGGIGSNSRFLTYTWSEYASLTKVPTTEELIKAIIPDAKVTEVCRLPISINEAINDPTRVRQLVAAGNYTKL